MKFVSLLLILYIGYYLTQILMDLLKLQKLDTGSAHAGGLMEIPLANPKPQEHVTVRVDLPDDFVGAEGRLGETEKKSP
ncbi:MAG: hypothetical protein JST58_04795 [Bacteroidetes bacterium]|nr:hypothetical protein [Bacteroidota bacterium]